MYCCHHDKVIVRVYPFHLMYVDQSQEGCESACRLLSPTSTIAIYNYSARS